MGSECLKLARLAAFDERNISPTLCIVTFDSSCGRCLTDIPRNRIDDFQRRIKAHGGVSMLAAADHRERARLLEAYFDDQDASDDNSEEEESEDDVLVQAGDCPTHFGATDAHAALKATLVFRFDRCICGHAPDSRNLPVILCDACERCFHMKCVGIEHSQAQVLDDDSLWYCDSCVRNYAPESIDKEPAQCRKMDLDIDAKESLRKRVFI
ncbi:hypothetical protein DL96DRAFT_1714103 [Flagelloscypha sp. PMI_526]|nr:hypothetical protein DL96DRAFT_1714103 [Flagelloscypha sp. PMI_526]